jgi:hypothetical protein
MRTPVRARPDAGWEPPDDGHGIRSRRFAMFYALSVILVFVVVFGLLALVAYVLYECSPLPHRTNPYRDDAGNRRWESPHL